MRGFLPILMIAAVCPLCLFGCSTQGSAEEPSAEVFARYTEHSAVSEPGKHHEMCADLPGPGKELCGIIKRQLIHPFELGDFEEELGREWRFEDLEFPDARCMLSGLAERGGAQLSERRQPHERLVVACWHHALLLTCILREQGIPVRMRAGFARYIGRDTGLHVGHVVCEVWDENRGRWVLIDPDRQIVDVRRSDFEFPSEAWAALRGGSEVSGYRSAQYEGAAAIVHLLALDMRLVIGEELPYWHDPDVVSFASGGVESLGAEQLGLLDDVAALMASPDESLEELEVLRSSSSLLDEVDRSEEMRQQLPVSQ